ncbi:MAG: hypothetical protein AAFQ87_14240 [Bacteroidota bacterium]
MTKKTKIPTWFWLLAGGALLWNLGGCASYLIQVSLTPEDLATMEEGVRGLYENLPAWVNAAYAIAVWAGAAGSLLLLLRRQLALPVLVVSLVGIVIQSSYNLFMSEAAAVYGTVGLMMPIMLVLIGLALIWFARYAKQQGWLR